MFLPPTEWQPTPVSKLPSWQGARRVGIDVECRDDDLTTLGIGVRRGGKMVGISFSIEDGPSHYLPFGHPEDNLDRQHVIDYMTDQCKTFDGDFVGANLGFDLDYLWEAGIRTPKAKRYRDVQIADPLIDETHFSYSLDNIATRHGLPGKDETLLREAARAFYVDPKKGLWQLPARFVGGYAEVDTALPLALLRRQEKIIEERGLDRIYDIETRLLPVLVKMRRRGVAIDLARLAWIEDWTMQQQQKAHEIIRELSGARLSIDDVNKAAAVAAIIRGYDKDIVIGATAQGQPNIDAAFLKGLKCTLGDAILRSKKLDKIRNTFAASIRRYMVNGRIHATFRQMVGSSNDANADEEKGVRFGRLSMADPNLQQQPSKDEDYDFKKENDLLCEEDFHIGKLWRSIYVPDDGMKWASADYSGQEPRMIVHYAHAARCAGADVMVAAYLANPDLDLHQMTADIAKIKRKPAKIIFLGVAYGMGGAKLCHSLGLPTKWVHSSWQNRMIEVAGPEGQEILDRYNGMVPFLIELRKKCEKRAGERGYITTIMGRQLHFPLARDKQTNEVIPGKYDYLHKALNRLVQGSAADQTKLAVVECDDAGEDLQLQVHDEIDSSVRDEPHAEKIANIMRNCIKLSVPSKVDVEIGSSWGDSM